MTAPTPVRPAVLLDDVRAGYDHRPVLRGVSAHLAGGQAVALLGPNGSGKSTLLKVVLGLLPPSSGRVEVFGQRPDQLDRRRRQIGYMPQLREVDRAFPATVFDLAMMGRVGRLGLFRRPSARDREVVHEALHRVGLLELASRPFGMLSGGQQQRAFLARALTQEPDVLVLDEPVAGIDEEHRGRIGELLSQLRADGLPILVATHDLDELEPFVFDQHWCLATGQLQVAAPATVHAHAGDRHEETPMARTAARPIGLLGPNRRVAG